jgi:hypothetical protein
VTSFFSLRKGSFPVCICLHNNFRREKGGIGEEEIRGLIVPVIVLEEMYSLVRI